MRVLASAAALAVWLLPAAQASAAVTRLPRGPVRGLDVSAFQHQGRPIDWRLLARHGIRFAAIKVSEGTYYTNPYYRTDARAASAAGLVVMPYVFANPRRSGGAAQARFGVRAAGYGRGRAALPVGVDLENDPYAATDHAGDCYGVRPRQMVAWIAAFTAQAVAMTGKPPIIYTTAAWWRECTGDTGRFRRDPLWVAAYDTRVPGVPSPWKRWTFWQYTDDARLAGVGITDVDYFHPTAALPSLTGQAAKHVNRRRAHPAPHPRAKPHPSAAPATPAPATPAPPKPEVRTWWVPPYLPGGAIRPKSPIRPAFAPMSL